MPSSELKELKVEMMVKPINKAALETVKARARVKVKTEEKEKGKAKEMAPSHPAGSSKNMEFASMAPIAALATMQKIRDEPRLEH